MKTNNTQKGALINTNTIKNMLRYKTKTRPGLVALYDIRPGNGVGPFLQPRSPHGATLNLQFQSTVTMNIKDTCAADRSDTVLVQREATVECLLAHVFVELVATSEVQ